MFHRRTLTATAGRRILTVRELVGRNRNGSGAAPGGNGSNHPSGTGGRSAHIDFIAVDKSCQSSSLMQRGRVSRRYCDQVVRRPRGRLPAA